VRQIQQRSAATICAGLILLLAGCATPVQVVKTFADPGYAQAAFSDVLVIGVAGSYDNRALFERTMAAQLSSMGIAGTAYYTVIGRNQPITRSDVSNAVQARGFDSVLLTRVVSQEVSASEKRGASTATATRKDDGVVDLFRYDYEVFSNPGTINIAHTVVLSTELYSATDEKRIWAIETTISAKENVSLLIDDAVVQIVGQLRKDKMIGR
jgi:hypothetical protein